MGDIDDIVKKARKHYEDMGYTVNKVHYESGTVIVECSKPDYGNINYVLGPRQLYDLGIYCE